MGGPRSAECRGIGILRGWPRHRRYERTMHGAALRSEATLRCGDDVGPGLCSCTRTRFAAWSSPPPVKLVASRDGEMRDVGQGKVPEKAAVQDSHALGVRTRRGCNDYSYGYVKCGSVGQSH